MAVAFAQAGPVLWPSIDADMHRMCTDCGQALSDICLVKYSLRRSHRIPISNENMVILYIEDL